MIGTEAVSADPTAALETEVVRRWGRWGEDIPRWGPVVEDRRAWVVVEVLPEWDLEAAAPLGWGFEGEDRLE